MAERTLSLDSFIEVSGRPTMLNERRPFARSHSHSTTYPFNPSKQHVFTFEYIISPCYLNINVISIEKWTTKSIDLILQQTLIIKQFYTNLLYILYHCIWTNKKSVQTNLHRYNTFILVIFSRFLVQLRPFRFALKLS